MALKVRLDAQAKRDLLEIRSHLIQHAGITVAERVREHLRQRINRLRDLPLMGVVTSEPAIRILPPTRYPYRIYYTLTSEAVVILHIRHTARRDPDLDELKR